MAAVNDPRQAPDGLIQGLQISSEDSETVISRPLPDQPALHEVLVKIRDLGPVNKRPEPLAADPRDPARCPVSARTPQPWFSDLPAGVEQAKTTARPAPYAPTAWPAHSNAANRTASGAARPSTRPRSPRGRDRAPNRHRRKPCIR